MAAMTDNLLHIRVVMPDLWREESLEVSAEKPVAELKRELLPKLLRGADGDPSEYYVEYFEKEVLDESQTLADLRVPDKGVVLIRPYDLDHPPPFRG